MQTKNDQMPIQERIETEHQILTKLTDLIRSNDTKCYTIITFQVAILALFSTKLSDIKDVWTNHAFELPALLLYILILTFVVYIIKSTFEVFLTFSPHIKDQTFSIFFFGSIINKSRTEYTDILKKLSFQDLENDLADQVYISAEIAQTKFDRVKKSIQSLLIGGTALVIAFVVLSIYH